ncbi:hypothetical protein DMA11_05995 [Marinilabiliaceae bacterium JC017]|nr:hypothetical protein DMA11_05995 [Marinilabiliaceae bacterium JC017]
MKKFMGRLHKWKDWGTFKMGIANSRVFALKMIFPTLTRNPYNYPHSNPNLDKPERDVAFSLLF